MHSRYFVAMVSKHKAAAVGSLDQKKLLEYEMIVVQELDFNLLLFSPHHSLKRYLLDLKADATLSQQAWSLVCEAHCCEACLVHPPFTIALGAILLAAKASEVRMCRHCSDVALGHLTTTIPGGSDSPSPCKITDGACNRVWWVCL